LKDDHDLAAENREKDLNREFGSKQEFVANNFWRRPIDDENDLEEMMRE
jgi:hypothetical protein